MPPTVDPDQDLEWPGLGFWVCERGAWRKCVSGLSMRLQANMLENVE